MSNRILDYPEATAITSDDYILLDNADTGAKCIKASALNINMDNYTIKEARGSIASFDDGEDLPLAFMGCYIEPQQDLHGYDYPWVGGAGKNKLPIDSLSISGGGITAVIDRDSNNNVVSVTVNGTASGVVYVILNTFTLPSGTYTMSGCPSNGGTDSYRLYDDKHTSWADNGSGASFTLSEASQVAPTIRIANGYTVNNLKFYPMIESGNTKTTFEPYSNICPISGWDECNVTVADDTTDPTVENVYTIDLDGTRYGGTLDVVSGVLTVDRGYVDLGTFNWTYLTSGSSLAPYFYADITSLGVKYEGNFETTVYPVLCSIYKTVNRNINVFIDGTLCMDGAVALQKVTHIQVKDSRYTSASDFKTAMAGQKIVYELATPLTYQLTPTMIYSLIGENNIFANTGDSIVDYRKLWVKPEM